jgi:hypothetical protein
MARLIEMLTNFTKRHPFLGGSLLIAVGVLMVADSIENAKEFHLLEDARERSAKVVSISDSTLLPPRWDVTVAWVAEGSRVEADISVGPKFVEGLEEGDSVEILIAGGGERVIFAAQRPTDRPVRLAGFEAMSLVYVGLIMSAAGAVIALFGKRLFGE